jgi:hypothetical protein
MAVVMGVEYDRRTRGRWGGGGAGGVNNGSWFSPHVADNKYIIIIVRFELFFCSTYLLAPTPTYVIIPNETKN